MSDDQIVALIQTHLARYPEAEVADVYKLLHQATFGPGHLIANKKAAREFLEQECGQVIPTPDASLLENVHPQGEVMRCYLRPYLVYRRKVDWLLDALVRSAEQIAGDAALMAARWQLFAQVCATGDLGVFDLREIELLGQFRAREDWPAVHHSPAYVTVYQPKYRVLTHDEARRLCERLRVTYEVV